MLQLGRYGFILLKKNLMSSRSSRYLVENKIGLRVKCFFLDDGEYYNKKFDDYCSTHGIKKEKIV